MLKKIMVCGISDELDATIEKFREGKVELYHEAYNLPGETEGIITKFGIKFLVMNYPCLVKKVLCNKLPIISLRKEIIYVLVNLSDYHMKEVLNTLLIMRIPLFIQESKISREVKYRITKRALHANVTVYFT
jgi:hypothetical protein